MQVIHEPDNHLFYISLDDNRAILKYRINEQGDYDLYHTFVPPAHRNKGIAEELVLAAIKQVRLRKVKILPTCPYIRTFIKRHPEFKDLMLSL